LRVRTRPEPLLRATVAADDPVPWCGIRTARVTLKATERRGEVRTNLP
jgi:hypothetical protein